MYNMTTVTRRSLRSKSIANLSIIPYEAVQRRSRAISFFERRQTQGLKSTRPSTDIVE